MIPKGQRPDVSDYSPKDLSIVIQEYKIDKSGLEGKSYEEQVAYVQTCIDKYPLQTYELHVALKRALERIYMIVTAYFIKMLKTFAPESWKALLTPLGLDDIPASANSILSISCKDAQITNLLKVYQTLSESIKPEYYRKYGFEIIEDEITNYSHPDESMKVLDKHKTAAKEYMNTKFSHLSCLCYEPSKLK